MSMLAVAGPAAASDADDLVGMLNAERAAVGADPLIVHDDLTVGAQAQAEAIADAGELFHNQDLGSLTTGWTRLGENVAFAGSVAGAHEAFMNSPDHRENMLLPAYTHVGVGVVVRGATVWVSEVFMESAEPVVESFNPPFSDDDGSIHEDSIRRLAEAGITSGCGGTLFCPNDSVTRGQMAAFLVRALDLKSSSQDVFTDDDSSMFEDAIQAFAEAGVTSGCGGTSFCPNDSVTRGQMAAFLVRALGLPPSSQDRFTDDNSSMFESAIESLADAGITTGCGPTSFCPNRAVTRAEMATFLVRAFGY